MDMNDAVAKAISAERGATGLTIKELSKKSGIPERTLVRLLKSEREIKVNQLEKLADAFGITPMKLLDEATDFKHRKSA